jgi:hypothetical protein
MIIHAAARCAFFFSFFFKFRDYRGWTNHGCWHHRYSHGFLFPSEAARAREGVRAFFNRKPGLTDLPTQSWYDRDWGAPPEWARSSVTTFGARYLLPLPDLTVPQSIEALVEGSDMSKLYEGMSPFFFLLVPSPY